MAITSTAVGRGASVGSPVPSPSPALTPAPVPQRVRGGALVLFTIVLVASNLRVAVTSVGALLGEVTRGVGLSHSLAGVMTALPVVAFGVFGGLTSRLAGRLGARTLLLISMTLLAAGQAVRALASSPAVFLAASAIALAGVAVANVLLPALVRRYFPAHRGDQSSWRDQPAPASRRGRPARLSSGTVTGLYSMTMITASAVAAAVTVPIARAAGSWRVGLGVWAVFAAAAAVAVLAMRREPAEPSTGRRERAEPSNGRRERAEPATGRREAVEPSTGNPVAGDAPAGTAPRIRPGRTRLGWAMAIFFGLQSLGAFAIMGWLPQLYRDAGFSAQTAGVLLAAMIAGSAVMALVTPRVATRRPDQRPLVLVLAGSAAVGYLGLALAPHQGAIIWTALLAVGQGAFPLALTLIGLRARSGSGVVALSAFTQSVGYLVAIAGPLTVGVLYQATGAWFAPLGVLLVALVIQAIAGLAVAKPRMLEDEWGEAANRD